MSATSPQTFAEQVQDWSLTDVVNHVFHCVWTCGTPVHQRYVAVLLAHSCATAELELATEAECTAFVLEERRRALDGVRGADTRAPQVTDASTAAHRQVQLERWARERVFTPVLDRARNTNDLITRAGLRLPSADGCTPVLTEVVALRLTTTDDSRHGGAAEASWRVVVDAPGGEEEATTAEALASLQPWEQSEVALREARAGTDPLTSAYWTSVEYAKVMEAYFASSRSGSDLDEKGHSVARRAPSCGRPARLRPGFLQPRAPAAGGDANAQEAIIVVDDKEDDDRSTERVGPRASALSTEARLRSQTATAAPQRKSRRLDEFFVLSASPSQRTKASPSSTAGGVELVVVVSSDEELSCERPPSSRNSTTTSAVVMADKPSGVSQTKRDL